METFLEILKFTIPSLITFGVAYLILNKFMDESQKKRAFELKKEHKNHLTPIRLQAYERMTLFLERSTPTNLIPRVYKPGMKAGQLHQTLLRTIRSEYEHNLAQQIYVSPKVWMVLQKGKEEMLKIINVAADQVDAEDDAIKLTKVIYNVVNEGKISPPQKALQILKQEVYKQFQ